MEEVTCSYCGKVYLRSPNRINEAIKFGWNQYCSSECQSKGKNLKTLLKCSNPRCQKTYLRKRSSIRTSGKTFCSNSCAAKINNKTRELKRPKKYCVNEDCGKEIKRNNKYCSSRCQWIVNSITEEEYKEVIIDKIKKFYTINKRIPFKQEMWGIHKPARRIFGSWNNAIISAGFKSNPVKFANKHIARDGHKCDSLAEKIIDDWLFERKIKHETKVPYNHRRMTADFKIDDVYIEFFGLQGEVKSYDRLIKEKEQLWKERNLEIIKIYPKDLFPKNKLDQIFAKITL